MDAQCACGALKVTLPDDITPAVVACHCTACQGRTGSPFGVGAYYLLTALTITGKATPWTREADSGGYLHDLFLSHLRVYRLLGHGKAPGSSRYRRRGDRRSALSRADPLGLGRNPA